MNFDILFNIFSLGIYSAYKNQCVLDSRTKKCTEELNLRLGNI